ncbi:hypothetical protein QYQ99_26940 [Comamonas testosteroni]|uniref:hypothetical protein n=1 Tax=Comamonas testosteroni TaxID=285 RepID=UPI00265FB4DD|nr:hypothetical protein [Comamonas testosteroni]WKL15905.1 hypothetical protein QYQ99_26940 [Comamonas testosteroni]
MNKLSVDDEKISRNYYLITFVTYFLVASLIIRVIFIRVYREGGGREYITDSISIALVVLISGMIFCRWFFLGKISIDIDGESSRQIYLACTELASQMHQGFRYFIKIVPSSILLEKTSEIAAMSKIVILDNFDIYRVIFMTKGFLPAIFLTFFVFLGGLYLGVDLFSKGSLQAFMPLTPVAMAICWMAVAYSIAWIALYSVVNIFRRK